jgi:hypothetical protein
MSMHEREGLIARVRALRRAKPASPADPRGEVQEPQTIEQRVAHLEELVEGLQDSIHRESVRMTKRVTDLEAKIEPSALAVALSRDARERGLQ